MPQPPAFDWRHTLITLISLTTLLLSALTHAADPQKKPDNGPLVTLRVIDAESGDRLKQFRVLPGTPYSLHAPGPERETAAWQPHLVRLGQDGHYEWSRERSYKIFKLRIEADGYRTRHTAWIQRSSPGIELTIPLQRDTGVAGRVLRPDGKPADEAWLGIGIPARTLRIKDGKLEGTDRRVAAKLSDQWRQPQVVKADGRGRYRLASEPGAGVVVAVHSSGYYESSVTDWEAQPEIRLQPWGHIDGVVRWIDQPGVKEKIAMTVSRDGYGYPDLVGTGSEAVSDGQGRFEFTKVPPGRVQLSRSFAFPDGGSFWFPYQHEQIKGGTNEVVFGGEGVTVTGRLSGLDDWSDIQLSYTPNTPRPGNTYAFRGRALVSASNIGPLYFRKGFHVAADGTFEIKNVLPGHYQLFIRNSDNSVYRVHGFWTRDEDVKIPVIDFGASKQ